MRAIRHRQQANEPGGTRLSAASRICSDMSEIVHATSPEQIEQVRNLFIEYRAQMPVQYCFKSFDAEIAGLPGGYAPPKGTLLLATVVGQPIGCVGLRPFPLESTCEMKR